MKKVFIYLKPYRVRMLFGFIIKVLGTFMDLGLPWVLAFIIDDVIPHQKISLIVWWGLAMVILSIGARTFNIIANRMASKVASDTVESLRHDLFQKILSLSGKQVDYFTIPSLESRMTSDTYNIHSMIAIMQRMGVRAPIILLGGIIITSTLEPVLTLVLIGIFPFLAITVIYISKKGIPLYTGLQETIDRMVRVVRENITGIRVIKSLSKTEHEKERFANINTEVVDRELKAGRTMSLTNPIMNLLLNIGLTLIVVVGAYRVNAGASEPGKIVAFLSYFTIMLHAVMAIRRIFVVYSKASASASRIADILDTQEDLPEFLMSELENKSGLKDVSDLKDKSGLKDASDLKDRSGLKDASDLKDKSGLKDDIILKQNIPETIHWDHIVFDRVSFSYTEEECLTDIDFKIKRGESLGIIGSTGSGKTTLINLLLRFYDVTQGRILVNGQDVRTYNKQELRRKFGVVFQNDVLFMDTIMENICLGRDLNKEQVESAGEHAQAAPFINELEDRYDFKLAIKGSNLSGGQKQRLLIARALAGKPEILILDDSSSALDYKTDSMLRKAIRDNYSNTTSIIIAQRISSVMKLDHILVLEDGKMAGYGKHEDLLENCQVYQEIYQSQLMT
ncbi:MAG TPA: ABC transporter ATP-binding protein [Clostridiales bacterium]|nr:ABC transporter ATP-binding protein [Clostridiales bacterium]